MKRNLLLCVSCSIFLGLLSGCNVDLAETTQKTDAHVYQILDETWKDDIGSKSNYRISDLANDPNSIDISVEIPASGIITLPQAVALATARNRVYTTEKETLYLTALDQIDVEHLYEPIPFAGGQGGVLKDGNGSRSEVFGQYGLQQLLATGAQVGGDISLGWVDIISGDFRSGFSTVATAVITQPLLRGAGRKIVLENLTQAQQNTLYQIRNFNRYRKEFVTFIISEYYLVLRLNDRQNNARDYYYDLVEVYKNLEKRAVAGRLPQHELEQANQDKLEALSSYTQSRKDYKNALDAFKMFLSVPPNAVLSLDMHELDALEKAVPNNLKLSEEYATEIALGQRLDLANAAEQIDDAERKVDVAADAIRAELNLIGVADTQKYDSQTTRERYELSLQLDLPIDRLTEKNAYRRTLIDLMQQQRNHQELTDTVILEVRKAYRQMQEARQRYEVEFRSYQLAEKRSKNTLLLLQYDRANTRDLLDARGDFLDAKNRASEAIVDYAIASLEFFRDTGTMKIKPDGMWEKTISFEVHAKQ